MRLRCSVLPALFLAMQWAVVGVIGVIAVGPALASDGSAEARPPAPRPPAAEDFELAGDLALGRAVFHQQCALCHGETGNGKGLIFMDPPPRDLRRPEHLVSRDDRELYRVIREGGQALGLSPKMLPWGDVLSQEELLGVATFVRSLGQTEGPAGE